MEQPNEALKEMMPGEAPVSMAENVYEKQLRTATKLQMNH